LRQSQEIRLLEAVKTVREQQIEEANENLEGLKRSKELAEKKKNYYESRDFMNVGEIVAVGLHWLSIVSHIAGTIADGPTVRTALVPDAKVGAAGLGGSPHDVGEPPAGKKVSKSVERAASVLYNIATILDKSAGLTSTMAGYQRRQEEWDFQTD